MQEYNEKRLKITDANRIHEKCNTCTWVHIPKLCPCGCGYGYCEIDEKWYKVKS